MSVTYSCANVDVLQWFAFYLRFVESNMLSSEESDLLYVECSDVGMVISK